jgi:hypothetical protein
VTVGPLRPLLLLLHCAELAAPEPSSSAANAVPAGPYSSAVDAAATGPSSSATAPAPSFSSGVELPRRRLRRCLFQVPMQVGGVSSGSGARRPAGTTQKSARDSGGFTWARLDLLFRPRSPPSAREDEADPRVRCLPWGSARWRAQAAEGRRSWRRKGGGLGRRGKKREWERQWVVTSPIEETWSSYHIVQLTKHEHSKSDYL